MAFRRGPEMAALIDEIPPDANVSLIRLANRFISGFCLEVLDVFFLFFYFEIKKKILLILS